MTKKSVKRTPIKIPEHMKTKRTPIKLDYTIKMKMKLRELQYLTKDEEILELSEYYNLLTAKTLNKASYNSLYITKNYKTHPNWKHFECVWEVCRMKDWDRNLYLEAQFKRATNWKYRKYPLPNMLYSVNALKYFTSHLSIIKQKHAKDLGSRQKQVGQRGMSRNAQIIDDITYSIDILSTHMNDSKHKDLEQYKVLKIYQSWSELSPYYLWSIPWFKDIVHELEGIKVDSLLEIFNMINKSPAIQKLIYKAVQLLEEHYQIPKNIKL